MQPATLSSLLFFPASVVNRDSTKQFWLSAELLSVRKRCQRMLNLALQCIKCVQTFNVENLFKFSLVCFCPDGMVRLYHRPFKLIQFVWWSCLLIIVWVHVWLLHECERSVWMNFCSGVLVDEYTSGYWVKGSNSWAFYQPGLSVNSICCLFISVLI